MVLSGPERKRLTHQPMREGCGRRKDANTSCFSKADRRTRHLCAKSLTAGGAAKQAKNPPFLIDLGARARVSDEPFHSTVRGGPRHADQRAKPVFRHRPI